MKLYASCYIFFVFSFLACAQPDKKAQTAAQQLQPAHYNINKPQVFAMPRVLNEISGIAFKNGVPDTIYAEQDEDGKLFYFHLGDTEVAENKFGKKGDYEDVQVCNNYVVLLRSDGALFTFPVTEKNNKNAAQVRQFISLLPRGEYEGMYADNAAGSLYVLCKHCNEKLSAVNSGYILAAAGDGSLSYTGNFTIDVKKIIKKAGDRKINFEPSALAKNKRSNEWYIVSSVNKMLVVTDSAWQVKEVYPLDPVLYNQPEGIAFDNAGNLYISNEKGNTGTATILKIKYEP